jgi:hypothetical protein
MAVQARAHDNTRWRDVVQLVAGEDRFTNKLLQRLLAHLHRPRRTCHQLKRRLPEHLLITSKESLIISTRALNCKTKQKITTTRTDLLNLLLQITHSTLSTVELYQHAKCIVRQIYAPTGYT